MKNLILGVVGLFLVFGLVQCTTMEKVGDWMAPEKGPTMAHVHIGHAMTNWKTTPDKMGLFIVAEKEADIAYTHASLALQKPIDLDRVKLHVGNAMHAIDPKTHKSGPGLGFGLKRALNEAVSHITFAAESTDASENVKDFVTTFGQNTTATIERCDLILALGTDIQKAESAQEAAALAEEVVILTQANVKGMNASGNGGAVTDPNDYGLKQLRTQIEEMIDREDPPYQPAPRRYLLGVVRLPSGEWTYWWRTTEQTGHTGGGGGY